MPPGEQTMKILLTSIIDLKKSQHNRPHQLIEHLSRKHEMTVVSINDVWKGIQDDLGSYSREFEDMFARIRYVYLTDRNISPVIQEVFFQRAIRKLVREDSYDLHLNYNTLVSGSAAAKRIPTVYDLADDLIAMIRASPQIPSLLRPLGKAWGNAVIHRNINDSRQVVITTDYLQKPYNIPAGKVNVIPNGVNTERFRDYGTSAMKEYGLDGFVLGYVGVLREWIEFRHVFSALKELKNDIKLVIIGKEGRYRENVDLARSYGLEDRVKFMGMVHYSKVPRLVSAMDVCLIPFARCPISDNSVPLKLFEYMACEKPVISTRLRGIEKIAGDRIMYADTRDEYKKAIMKLYEDEGLRRQMGAAGRKFVKEKYDWGTLMPAYEKILTRTLDMRLQGES